jgi:hypothetical protein
MYSAPLDPATFAKSVMIESSDIPPDMTLAQWRAEKQLKAMRSRRRRRRLRVLRRLQVAS